MEKLIAFGVLSLAAVIISRRTLVDPGSHGFYRFFSWECISWLFVSDYQFWFVDPFSPKQLLSWTFLSISAYLVIAGVLLLIKKGKPEKGRDEKALYRFEKTTELVEQGIFKYIRHPLYSSLIFLTWGVFLKNTTTLLFFVALLSTTFLYLTAVLDEKECIYYFGNKYRDYMKRSKRFIPFLV